ncbi:tRNA-splicing endonuclease [Candidatus Bilamarchaeum dharawalense]|uniref:tRNA-splicing endonuclease n=1 Tax=Candidatus Bilamarchaeum dharawalense TaxID=2885759 RepID=A0A5E4LSC5_9ARCH|nr:tRNA-splicing endonuclease [Candidatus Bilamarchaeum dharawalense]
MKYETKDNFLILTEKSLILKLRSLGAGIEEGDETKITFLEAAYFAERGVLPISKDELLELASRTDKLYKEKFLVIKYLRDHGYIVRPSLDGTPYLRLHRKGYRPGEDKTYYLIEVVKKDWTASSDSLAAPLETAGKLRKELAIAIVGDDKEPKFLKFARLNFE